MLKRATRNWMFTNFPKHFRAADVIIFLSFVVCEIFPLSLLCENNQKKVCID